MQRTQLDNETRRVLVIFIRTIDASENKSLYSKPQFCLPQPAEVHLFRSTKVGQIEPSNCRFYRCQQVSAKIFVFKTQFPHRTWKPLAVSAHKRLKVNGFC